jgi:Choline-binding repeat/Putative cell wall binding repeat
MILSKNIKALFLVFFLMLSVFPASETEAATQNQWVQHNGQWNYYNSNGSLHKGWLSLQNTWYYLDSKGIMKTGWISDGGKWYFMKASGAMATGWIKSGNEWYYMNQSGVMSSGWIKDGGKWYYLKASGAMATGWVKSGNEWYYMNQSGVMSSGWIKDGGKWYYLKASGSMATGWVNSGGQWYYLNNGGIMQTGWIQDGEQEYFLRDNGSWDEHATLETNGEIIYTVAGSETASPGIYKGVPNEKSTLLLEEKMYSRVQLSNVPLSLGDVNYFTEKGSVTTEYDLWGNVNNPIQSAERYNSDIYYTNYLFTGEYGGSCGGGYADILELYKQDSSGNISKVTSDKVSSVTEEQFVIKDSSMYYAKVEDKAFGNFTLVKMNLMDKKKTSLTTGIENFWLHDDLIYYVKDRELFTMNLVGGDVKKVAGVEGQLYGMSGCSPPSYEVTDNGLYSNYSDDDTYETTYFFYDFSSKEITVIPVEKMIETLNGFPEVMDVDVENKRLAAIVYHYGEEDTTATLAIYDFEGELLETLGTLNETFSVYGNTVSLDVKKGEFIYTEGTNLKVINF